MTSSTPGAPARPHVGRATPTTSKRHWSVRWFHLVLATIVVAVPVWLLAGATARVATEFEFTGMPQNYIVPAGVCRVRIEAIGGAGGGAGTAGAPGAGARAVATFDVAPGETLRVRVGGWGGQAVGSTPGVGGWNGGGAGGEAFDRRAGRLGKAGSGGGGATDVRRGGDGLEHRIIVGPGGSGGAGGAIGGPIGTGGGGGDLIGQDGFAALGSANPATGGKGGTQTAGGAPGRNAPDLSVTATAGSVGVGGNGASGGASGGGGGGGGLYGGGGGGSSGVFSGGHGGGGSGFGPAETALRPGVGGGFGRATITYDPDTDACADATVSTTGR